MKIDLNAPVIVITWGKQSIFSTDNTCLCYEKIPENITQEQGIVLCSDVAPSSAIALITQIRQSKTLRLMPLFVTSTGSSVFDYTDGLVLTIADVRAKLEQLAASLEPLSAECAASDDLALLGFMESRKLLLHPVRTRAANMFYEYPLAALFCTGDTDYWNLLSRLSTKGLLEKQNIVARVRCCPQDGTSQLNYVDVCPSCKSINIEKKPFLHCFTCSHVAPQENFLSPAGLVCPNCRTLLRHIGADYDRPLESYQCNDCKTKFIEPEIIVECITCGMKFMPHELDVKSFHILHHTNKASLAIRTGTLKEIYSMLDELQYVHPQYFEIHFDWMLHMVKRYPDTPFSVIGIHLTNISSLVKCLGKVQVYALMENFASRLRRLLRITDITTRSDTDTLWLLLPHTSASGCTQLCQRIADLGADTVQPDGNRLQYTLFQHTELGNRPAEENASFVLAQYMSALCG